MKLQTQLRAPLMSLAAVSVLAISSQLSRAQDQVPAADQAQANPHAGHQMPGMEKKDQGQKTPPHGHSQVAGYQGMQMQGMNHGDMNEAGMFLMSMASGTSMNPESWRMPMLMPRLGSWNLMVMGQAYLVDTQQSGPRGGDKFYSPNWGMLSAEHKLGGGSFMLQSMFSLDPATITHESYPLLFQTGETAYGFTRQRKKILSPAELRSWAKTSSLQTTPPLSTA